MADEIEVDEDAGGGLRWTAAGSDRGRRRGDDVVEGDRWRRAGRHGTEAEAPLQPGGVLEADDLLAVDPDADQVADRVDRRAVDAARQVERARHRSRQHRAL